MKLTVHIICLMAFLFLSVIENKTEFEPKKLAEELKSRALKLERALSVNRNHLPVFDVVKDFGAVNTGLQITTKQLQNAIDSSAKSGGLGRVFFPSGIYLTGTLILKSGVHLEFAEGVKILGSADESDYPVFSPEYKNNTDRQVNKSLFYAEKVDGISMTGKAIIDFQGTHAVYLHTGNNDPRRPFGIRFISSKNIYMNGLTLMNSPQWMQHYLDCENVLLENLTVFNHAHQNNDGIDIDGCRNVYVRNCRVDSDDDAICLKSNGPSLCENILIENCVVSSHCNALKLGTETTGGFRNILFRNCKVVPSVTGHQHINGTETTITAITLIITDGGIMENVWLDSIEASACVTPIYMTLGNRSRKYTDGVPTPEIGSIKNIKISNIKATGAGPMSSSVTGLNNSHRIKNIILENISIELTSPGEIEDRSADMNRLFQEKKSLYPSPHVWGNLPSYGFYFRYIEGMELTNIDLILKCKDPREAIIIEDCEGIKKYKDKK
ncbi:MAG TPA: glycosyl hydrolase family 28 protein [Cytophagaceae bacterium]|jgi:polygalacturonase|nr:glycosyl hydrolase family 28 protein [Cytophagaceae bacterium]